MKEKLKNVFLILLALMFVGYLLVTAVLDLTNRKDIHTIHADEAIEILVIEHSVNGLIPVGKDHYYIAVDDSTGDACLIKGSTGWYKKNFEENGLSKQSGGITITSLAKKVSDFDVEKELSARASQITGVNLVVPPNYALDLSYLTDAILKLVLLVGAVALVLWGKRISDSKDMRSPTEVKIFIVVAILVLVLLLRVLI